MVRLVMPETPPLPEEVQKDKVSKLRQIVGYLFYILFFVLCVAALWYAQTNGYIDFGRFTNSF